MFEIIKCTIIVLIATSLVLITGSCNSSPKGNQAYESTNSRETSASHLTLTLAQRNSESDDPVLNWSTDEISSLLKTVAPKEGYWDPGKVILACLSSESRVEATDFTIPPINIGYSGDAAIEALDKGDVPILKTVNLGTQDGVCVFDIERQNSQDFSFFIAKMEGGIRYGVAPLPVKPPLVLKNLHPGYYVVRIVILDKKGTGSKWISFEVKK